MYNDNGLILSLNADTFAGFKSDFDQILNRTVNTMQTKGASTATISVKITVDTDRKTINDPDSGTREIIVPNFKHDINSVMQVKDKKSGNLSGNYELVWDDEEGKYVMREVNDGQTTLYDMPGASSRPSSDNDIADAEYSTVETPALGAPKAQLEAHPDSASKDYALEASEFEDFTDNIPFRCVIGKFDDLDALNEFSDELSNLGVECFCCDTNGEPLEDGLFLSTEPMPKNAAVGISIKAKNSGYDVTFHVNYSNDEDSEA